MKFKIKRFLLVSVLIGIILFSICPKAFATNGNEMSILSKDGIGNTIEIISGNTNSIRSESVADVVSYLTGQNITVNSITNHKGTSVELTSTALIGTGYVLDTNNGNYSVIVYGDANGDGEADAGDMKIIIDNFLGIKQASPIAKIAVDLYQDGDLDAADLKQVLDSFLGNLTGSILKTTSASNPTPTPTPDISVTPTPTPTQVSSGPQIKVDGQTIELTPENAPEYYGKVITNYHVNSLNEELTWRLFYVDFTGEFGKEGQVYLKADPITVTYKSLSAGASYAWLEKMNPEWTVKDGVMDKPNERVASVIACNTSYWLEVEGNYQERQKADWISGSPGVEMYVASYNQYHSKKGTWGYEQLNCKWFSENLDRFSRGYKFSLGTSDYNFSSGAAYEFKKLLPDENDMYANSWYALTSPAASSDVAICYVNQDSLAYYNWYKETKTLTLGISPLTALKNSVIPEIAPTPTPTPTPEVQYPKIKVITCSNIDNAVTVPYATMEGRIMKEGSNKPAYFRTDSSGVSDYFQDALKDTDYVYINSLIGFSSSDYENNLGVDNVTVYRTGEFYISGDHVRVEYDETANEIRIYYLFKSK